MSERGPWRAAPDFDEQNLPATFPRLVGKKGFSQLLINMEDLFIATTPAQLDGSLPPSPFRVRPGGATSRDGG